MRSKEDKKKILLLRLLIVFIVVLLISLTVVFIVSTISAKNKKDGELSTTARRTYETTERTTQEGDSGESDPFEETTTTSVEETTTQTNTTTTSYTTGATTTMVTRITTTYVAPQTTTQYVAPTTKARNIVTGATSTYGAIDSWEWNIVNMVNSDRSARGLSTLQVDGDLRTRAEVAANDWSELTSAEFKSKLSGYNYFASWDQALPATTGYKVFYNETTNSTDVTTNGKYNYVGVGVIGKVSTTTGYPTFYYVIIYE